MKKRIACLFLLTACNANVVQPNIINKIELPSTSSASVPTAPVNQPPRNRKPVIQQLLVNPTQTAGPEDVLTLRALVHDADGDVLKMTWAATKGTISSNQGELISWSPKRSDGQVIAGTATISLMVLDGDGGSDTSSVNITISANGSSQMESTPSVPSVPAPDSGPPSEQPSEPDPSLPAPPVFVEESP